MHLGSTTYCNLCTQYFTAESTDATCPNCLELNILKACPPGSKHDTDKVMLHSFPTESLLETLKVSTFGAKKYSLNNWHQVKDARARYYDAAFRHMASWRMGEKLDPESGFHHLAHAICCLGFAMWFDLTGKAE